METRQFPNLGQSKRIISDPPSNQMVELVRFATLAANSHNTQPWKFAIKENVIEIHPDYTRHLPAVDPHDRELWISLGCALENLLLAAQKLGYAPEVVYPDSQDFIRINLTADTPQSSLLFDAIPQRQCTRSKYSGQPVAIGDFDQLQNLPSEPGVGLHFITNPTKMESVVEYVNQGNLAQFADKAFMDELIAWIRFNKKEAFTSYDGLYSASAGNPQTPRWLGRMFVAGTKPQRQADSDAKKMHSSAGAIIITSISEDKTSWVRTGQVCERMTLQMTALKIRSAFLNQPIEVTELRGQFQSTMGLGSSLPQLLLRFGYAEPMPKSLRRPVEQILT